MARKKGGKKKKSSSVQPETIDQMEQTTLQSEAAEPIPETEQAEPEKAPVLAEALSDVIGEQGTGKKEKKFTKKFKTQLAKFTADGYDVSALEAMADTGSTGELKDALKNFEEAIEKTKAIKVAMSEVDLTGFDAEKGSLEALLADPMKHGEAAELLASVKFSRRKAEIESALHKMVLPAMKAKVEAMKAMIQSSRDFDAIETEFSNLKREYKEAYAEEGVKAEVTSQPEITKPESARPEQRQKQPMTVKDIFLLYKDGRFISHHTTRVVSKEQQKELFADLKLGRDLLRSPKYQPQKLNIISNQGRSVLVQSGRFTVVIVVSEGSVDPWSEKITTKVINLMEKEDLMYLKDWNGDVSVLKSSGKYMQALLFAFMKLAKKGTQ